MGRAPSLLSKALPEALEGRPEVVRAAIITIAQREGREVLVFSTAKLAAFMVNSFARG
jgi:hypothetical protein